MSSALNCTIKGLAVLQNDCELTDEKDKNLDYDKLNSGLDKAEKNVSKTYQRQQIKIILYASSIRPKVAIHKLTGMIGNTFLK